jgi:outer membrane protein OmpA-like peptidoglycan-associated protein
MRKRSIGRRRAHAVSGYGSQQEARSADLFWAALVGEPAGLPAPPPRGLLTRAPVARRPVVPVPMRGPAYEDVDSTWMPAEAMPAGQTASPCDISKTSETLGGFALNSANLTAAHRTRIGTIAGCLLALRAGTRPIRNVDIVGFTDPSGGPVHNNTLGQRRAEAVRDALVAELNRQSAGSAASFVFRLRSAGQSQQIPGGAAANRRVEVFVEISVTDLVVHASDADTHEIPSNRGVAGLEHFCCVQGTGDVVLEAQISPNVPGAIGGRLTWEATGTAITAPAVGTDGRTARLSSAAQGKFPIQLKWDGAAVRQAIVWVIWSRACVVETRAVTTPAEAGFAGLVITAGIDHFFQILPTAIILDADRPALNGPRTAPVPGAALTHLITGAPLGGGAPNKWDASRQIRMKVLNPHLYPVAQLPAVVGHIWNGQPAATTIPENYPANDTIGNDDGHPGDEKNDPYTNCGVVTAKDNPRMSLANTTGANGDTFEMRFQFREFLRVNLGPNWYRASDVSLWRFHPRFRRAGGVWTNNGSTFARDNNGF